MDHIVAKFGGTSLADASQIRKVVEIVRANPERRIIVVSAPGKRNPMDEKVTDLLYSWYRNANDVGVSRRCFEKASARYLEIANELGLDIDLQRELDDIWRACERTRALCDDYLPSRGEYLSALIVAAALKYEFADAANLICFKDSGAVDLEESSKRLEWIHSTKKNRKAGWVIPGFYGRTPWGGIKTFSRGGSDISGAIVAFGTEASLYENWTDVSGILTAHPHIVKDPEPIRTITYAELRELSYMGASVMHEEAVFPAMKVGIPIRVMNTNRPEDMGTTVTREIDPHSRPAGSIAGIAGRKGFSVIYVEKTMMNSEIGFVRKACLALEQQGVSFEHMPSGIDSLSIIVDERQLKEKEGAVLDGIRRECRPDVIRIEHGMAMICTVGQAMARTPGVAAKLFRALADASISVRMINQGSSEISIIVGLADKDMEESIRAIYKAFLPQH